MPVRDTKYGAHIDRNRTLSRQATLEQLQRQSAADSFGAIPATKQWTCGCGGVNASGKTRCRWCGEDRA